MSLVTETNRLDRSPFSPDEKVILTTYVEQFRDGGIKERKALLREKVLPEIKFLNSSLNSEQWKLHKMVHFLPVY